MKINVAVIFGGKSVEHEISVISALQAVHSLDKDKYEIFPVYLTKKNEFYYGKLLADIENFKDIPALLGKSERINFTTEKGKCYITRAARRLGGQKPIAQIDAAFPIVHGTNVEDGALQGFLKTVNVPFVGSDVLASAVCMDKYVSKTLLKEFGVPVLPCVRFSNTDDAKVIIEKTESTFGYPVIVKPVNLGSSVGIGKAGNAAELEDAVDLAFTFANQIIVERAIVNIREINCAVLGDSDSAEASFCEQPFANDEILSYEDKYLSDGKSKGGGKGMASLKRKIPADIPDELTKKIQSFAVDAFKHLGLNGVARIDFITDHETDEVWLNEINSIPGSLSFYLWEPAGLSYSELLDKLISLALKRRRTEENIMYSFDSNILSLSKGFGGKGGK